MAAGFDGTIKIDSSIDTKGFNKGVSGISKSLKKLAGAIAITFGARIITQFGKTAVDEASKMASALIGLQSVVEGTGNSLNVAQDFIDSFIADGLVPAGDAITAYKNLLLRGYDTGQIEKTLTALKDSAAFGRQASRTIGQAVSSATEGLKNENSILVDNAGVTKNVSAIWKDYAESIGTTVDNLTKAQKIIAEVAGIQEETRFQTGDAAKAADTYAGKIASLSVSFLNFKIAVGNTIIPILEQIIPIIRTTVDAITVLFNQLGRIINLLFGTNIGAAAAEGLDSVASSANAAADAEGALGDATKKAGKDAKGALAAFDDINVLQEKTEAGAGAAGVGGGVGGDILDLPPIADSDFVNTMDDLAGRVAEWKAAFLEFISPTTEALGRLKEALEPLGKTLWEGLKWAWDNIIVPLGAWTITNLLPAFIDLLAVAVTALNAILIIAGPEIAAFFAIWAGVKIVGKIIALTAAIVANTAAWIASAAAKAADIIETLIIVGLYAADFVTNIIASTAAIWLNVTAWLASTAAKIADIVQLLILNTTLLIYEGLAWLSAAATSAFAAAMAVLTSPITLVVVAIVALLAILFLLWKNWDVVADAGARAWETLKQLWFLAGHFFKTKVADPIKNAFISAFQIVFSVVKGIMNRIIDLVNGMISGIVLGINAIILAANVVGSILPGSPSIGFVTAPKIPRLATGGVIPPNAEFAAILGDNKKESEILAPESKLRQIFREEAGGGGGDITIKFEGSLSELGRILKPVIDKENGRIGGSIIAGGSFA